MPKTKEEKDTLNKFKKEYKDPKKAKEVYYALRNKDKKFDRSQGGGFSDKAEHEGHLVTDEKGKKHLPTNSNGKPNHRLMGAAWAALHGGYRGNKYEGPDKSKAIAKLKRLYHREGMKPPSGKAAIMDDKSIKENRSQYPANELGFTTSMGPADLSGFAEASQKASPLWWAVRITKLPVSIKTRLLKSLEFKPAVNWWTERIDTLSTNVGKHEEDDKEDHTAG